MSAVLVTGPHRSGTTWVGKMLCLSRELGFIFEPMRATGAGTGPHWGSIPYVYPYIGPENEAGFSPLVRQICQMRYPLLDQAREVRTLRHLGRLCKLWTTNTGYWLRRVSPLVKDPFALFMAEWMVDRFDVKPVILIRHPAAFTSSLKRLNWHFDFRHWLDQPLLMEHYLQPFSTELVRQSSAKYDICDQAILLWNVIHHTIHLYQQRHPDWLFVRYEDLAASPLQGFQHLYRDLGLQWNDRVEARIAKFTSPQNPTDTARGDWQLRPRDSRASVHTWQTRLLPDEIARIRDGTAEVAYYFYSDADWDC